MSDAKVIFKLTNIKNDIQYVEECAWKEEVTITFLITKSNSTKMHKFKNIACRALTTTSLDTILPNLLHRYEALISRGFLQSDESQLQCLERLQSLLEDLHLYGRKLKTYEDERTNYEVKRTIAEQNIREELQRQKFQHADGGGGGSGWKNLFSSFNTEKEERGDSGSTRIHLELDQKVDSLLGPPPRAPPAPRGVYLFGSVGSGKTMLADMLFDAATESQVVPLRRRLHCNAALMELHSRMHTLERRNSFIGLPNNNSDTSDDFLGKNAKVARIAHRRLVRERMMTPLEEYSKGIATANSAIMLKAARELLRSPASFSPSSDALNKISNTTTTTAALLCFDEMQTTDPYNVAALKALTEAALQDGGTLVATSNRAPKELSPHGLHEAMFEHFVETLERECDVVELSSPEDYRRKQLVNLSSSKKKKKQEETKNNNKYYFWPLCATSGAELASAWGGLKDTEEIQHPIEIPVMFGRTLTVPKHRISTTQSTSTSTAAPAAWFSFDELCGKPLGPTDYIALASHFKTVFISDVPAMSMRVRDKARRFITLIDEIYNQRGRVVCTAAVELDQLFSAAGDELNEEPLVDLEGLQFEGAVEGAKLRRDLTQTGGVAPIAMTGKRIAALGGEEERFAFARAVSRLYEMQSERYNEMK